MDSSNLLEALYSIGIILLMLYAFTTILGLSIMVSLIGFNILWSFIESPIISTLGHDLSSVFYILGIVFCITLSISFTKNYIQKESLKNA